MKKFGLVFLVIAFFALVLVSVSSNDSNRGVNQRTGNRISSPSNPGFTPPAPQRAPAQATAGGSQPVATTTPAPSGDTPRLNPPHGQPGHICEIPVGSPLPSSSAPAAAGTNAPAGSSAGSQPVATATPTPSGDTPRLNPPHGQPGHICEIPVGSPLPASSGSTTGGVAPSAQSVQTTTAAPTASGDTPRLNPPHGQPGHICEIPVGSPLPASNGQ